MTIQYRYQMPPVLFNCETRSFGIEPYRLRGNRQVKAGKAIVRLVIYRHVTDSDSDAEAVAERIVQLLNNGREYMGPKTLHFDWNRRHTSASVEGYF